MSQRPKPAARQAGTAPYAALVLDADGLTKAAHGHLGAPGRPGARALVLAAAQLGTPVLACAVTLTETLRGGARDAHIHRLIKGVQIIHVDAANARSAGELLGATARSDTIDALVAVTAAQATARHGEPVLILTSDPNDVTHLTADTPGIHIHAV